MIEFADNLSQFLAALTGCVLAGLHWARTRSQPWLLLAGFYGCFALGGLYWTLYYALFAQTPQIFYVSEVGWVSSYLFLILLQYSLSGEAERARRCPAGTAAALAGLPLCVFYCLWGDVLLNVVVFVLFAAIARAAVRGLCYSRQTGDRHNRRFHRVVVLFAVTEYALWTASCFWVSDTLTNPYFWFDFLLTGTLLLFLPATRKAVEP